MRCMVTLDRGVPYTNDLVLLEVFGDDLEVIETGKGADVASVGGGKGVYECQKFLLGLDGSSIERGRVDWCTWRWSWWS